MPKLQEQFGQIDIYLFDQILRARIVPGMRVLDAGCGFGRNLVYFLREGCEVFGVDSVPQAIEVTRKLAASLVPDFPGENFRQEAIEAMSFPDDFADVVLSSAVLHFARDDEHFLIGGDLTEFVICSNLHSLWRKTSGRDSRVAFIGSPVHRTFGLVGVTQAGSNIGFPRERRTCGSWLRAPNHWARSTHIIIYCLLVFASHGISRKRQARDGT